MCNQVDRKHSTSTRCTLLNKELAEDKFHEFFISIPSRLKRRVWSTLGEKPTVDPFWELQKQKKEKFRCNDILHTLRHILKVNKKDKRVSWKFDWWVNTASGWWHEELDLCGLKWMLIRGMPLCKIETNSHFTFLQGINSGIIILNKKNLFDWYLVNKRIQIKKLG